MVLEVIIHIAGHQPCASIRDPEVSNLLAEQFKQLSAHRTMHF